MTAKIIDGRALGQGIKEEAAQQVRALRERGVRVSLDAVIVGDPATGGIYARSQRNRCQEVGIEYRLHSLSMDASEAEIRGGRRALSTWWIESSGEC